MSFDISLYLGLFKMDNQFSSLEDDTSFQAAGVHHHNRVIRACRSKYAALSEKIDECSERRRCDSYWCKECRNRHAFGLRDRISSYLSGRYGTDYEEAKKHLRYVTVLVSVERLDEHSVSKAIREARTQIDGLKKSFKGIWMEGAFELELLDLHALSTFDGNPRKKDTIFSMWEPQSFWNWECLETYHDFGSNRVLVHFHILVDLNGFDESKFHKLLRKRWGKHRHQIDVAPMKDNQTLHDMAWKVGSYPFKDRVQYNLRMETDGYKDGRYFSDRMLAELVRLHDQIGPNGLLLGTNGSWFEDQRLKNELRLKKRYERMMTAIQTERDDHEARKSLGREDVSFMSLERFMEAGDEA
jgi:hypothetical protein